MGAVGGSPLAAGTSHRLTPATIPVPATGRSWGPHSDRDKTEGPPWRAFSATAGHFGSQGGVTLATKCTGPMVAPLRPYDPPVNCAVSTCANPGVHSCSRCGRLYCGRHAEVRPGTSSTATIVQCQECRALAATESEVTVARIEDHEYVIAKVWAIGAFVLLILLTIWGLTVGHHPEDILALTLGIVVALVEMLALGGVIKGWYRSRHRDSNKRSAF